jgi:DNA repair exonuclease SbcCD ATPase subunit
MTNRPPLLSSLLHPLNLSMLALTAAAGLCSAWWLAPIGLVFWLIMVIAVARDPGLQMTFSRQSREPLAQRFQNRFDRLDRARISIFNSLQGVSPAFRRNIQPVQDALDELTEHAYQLCLNMTALDNNFSVQQLAASSFDDDIASMEKNIAAAANANEKREYEEALKSLQARKAQMKNVGTLLSRFEAQLTGTNNAVDSVMTGIASLKGREVKQVKAKVPPLLEALQTEQAELQQFDAELEKTSLL